MKIATVLIAALFTSNEVNGFVTNSYPTFTRARSSLDVSKEILSDTDIMCIMNAADLCSLFDTCEIEEREAMLNRFEEQNGILVDRIAMMTNLIKHLKTGDHKHLEEEETAVLKEKILTLIHDAEEDVQP